MFVEYILFATFGQLIKERKTSQAKGIKLNVPEAIAYITDTMVEGAREDKTVAQLMSEGTKLLTTDDVLPGVAELIPLIQVEAHFLDGTKLISIHNPISSP